MALVKPGPAAWKAHCSSIKCLRNHVQFCLKPISFCAKSLIVDGMLIHHRRILNKLLLVGNRLIGGSLFVILVVLHVGCTEGPSDGRVVVPVKNAQHRRTRGGTRYCK